MCSGLFVFDQAILIFASLAVSALSVFLGVAMLSPLLVAPVVGAIGRPFAALFRISGRLARANAIRNPHRTAKTASALMVGLALVTMVSVVGASLKESFASSVEDAVTADYVISTANGTGFSPTVVDALEAEPQTDQVTRGPIRPVHLRGGREGPDRRRPGDRVRPGGRRRAGG